MKESRTFKIILIVSSALTLLLLMVAVTQENIAVKWKDYQRTYRDTLLSLAKTPAEKSAAAIEVKLRQEFLPELNRIDRCTTCHLGVENPALAKAEQPLTFHSSNIFKNHPLSKFGCSVCHDGQGLATLTDDAHGNVEHWTTPLLKGELVYTSCGRCHYENDLYGAENDLFTVGTSINPPLMQEELLSHVPGSENIARGKQLVLASGCLGCHKYRGHGGRLGPDITFVGDKTKHDYDFSHMKGEHTVQNWLLEHFKNPDDLSPGTLMPAMKLTDQQAYDLTLYMLSLHRKSMPASHTPIPSRNKREQATGSQLYAIFCSSCHGSNGQGSTVRDPLLEAAADVPPELMVPSINNPDTLAIASNDYLRYIVQNGRPESTMIAWADSAGGGLRPDEIERIISFMRTWEPPLPDKNAIAAYRGNAEMGKLFYVRNCSSCHGTGGEGGIGTSLNAPGFLAIASDYFLAHTLIEGRPNTAMPSFRQFNSLEISDIIAYLRSWHQKRNTQKATLHNLSQINKNTNVTTRIGEIFYKSNCALCHAANGEGDLGPSIATQEFLTIADNTYLYKTLTLGRPGTGMPAWQHFSDQDMASLLGFVRTWQTEKSHKLPVQKMRGDWDIGEMQYEKLCSSCHGVNAEGGVGPQLHNQVFLESTSDAMLYQWIAYGKTGTQMRAFTKGAQGMVEISPDRIMDVISYLRYLERQPRESVMISPNGRPELGEIWYTYVCAPCHGGRGEGASGPSLTNKEFLHSASDGYLMATMAMGRDGTEMRPVKKSPQANVSLSSDQINDVVAYLRSYMFLETTEIPHNYVIPWDLTRGQRLYEANCAGCHGLNGKAEITGPGLLSAWAPSLNNDGFLSAATDGVLQATIVRGRTGTAMLPFGIGMQGMVDLTPQEIDDVVAFIRRWSSQHVSPMTIPAEFTIQTSMGLSY
jgi:mono/diheme cytochrome c family protein